MGEAKRRGTFESRKTQAEQRRDTAVEEPSTPPRSRRVGVSRSVGVLATMAAAMGTGWPVSYRG